MIGRISDKFVQLLERENVISGDDTDIYSYGLFQLLMMCLNVITTILVGMLLKEFIPCLLLNIFYIPLRINAGGFHAKTPFRCYLYSTIIIVSLLLILKYIPISLLTSLILLIISSVVVWIIAPVATVDDPFDEIEKTVYKKRTKIVLIFEVVFFIIFAIFFSRWLSNTIVLSVVTEATMLLLGKKHQIIDL